MTKQTDGGQLMPAGFANITAMKAMCHHAAKPLDM
jgi:hypothetical protein